MDVICNVIPMIIETASNNIYLINAATMHYVSYVNYNTRYNVKILGINLRKIVLKQVRYKKLCFPSLTAILHESIDYLFCDSLSNNYVCILLGELIGHYNSNSHSEQALSNIAECLLHQSVC